LVTVLLPLLKKTMEYGIFWAKLSAFGGKNEEDLSF
jgi:hypothetical protein